LRPDTGKFKRELSFIHDFLATVSDLKNSQMRDNSSIKV
jgi:hypothetical protein